MIRSTGSTFLASVTAVGILALTALPQAAQAQNLVSNPGFETGSFSSWALGGNTGFTFIDGVPYAHSGNFGMRAGAVGSQSLLSQTLNTVAGQTYSFSYWLANFARSDGALIPNSFQASWNGTAVQTLTDVGAFGYTKFSFNVVATSASTDILFAHRQDPWYFGLDDVSVTALTPELPGAMQLLPALLPVGFIALKRRRSKASI